jgi:hypothetical protein
LRLEFTEIFESFKKLSEILGIFGVILRTALKGMLDVKSITKAFHGSKPEFYKYGKIRIVEVC